MIQLVADSTWQGLEHFLDADARRRAAISYVSQAAVNLLSLGSGDMVIVDGSDAALRAGQVDPAAISHWIQENVDVRTLPDLHAKVIHLEGGQTYVVVGSANASARSRDVLREAAVVTDDESLCAQVAEQLDVWWAESDPIDQAWLKHARDIYRPPAPVPAQRRNERRPRRLWVGIAVNDSTPVPQKVAAEQAKLEQRHGRGTVGWWRMNPGDERAVRPGDDVVLVQAGARLLHPRRNSPASPPAVVARVVMDRRRPHAMLVWPDDGDGPAPRTYGEVLDALDGVGGEIDWDNPFPARSAEAEAIRAQWRKHNAQPDKR